MRVVECNGFAARCEARGIEREVSLFLLQHETIAPGDHLMVHIGQAIRKMTEAEAKGTWELFDEIFVRESRQGGLMPSE